MEQGRNIKRSPDTSSKNEGEEDEQGAELAEGAWSGDEPLPV